MDLQHAANGVGGTTKGGEGEAKVDVGSGRDESERNGIVEFLIYLFFIFIFSY